MKTKKEQLREKMVDELVIRKKDVGREHG